MRWLLGLGSKKSKAETPAELLTSSTPSASAEPAVAHGLQVVAEGTNPVVDVVAIHGLNRRVAASTGCATCSPMNCPTRAYSAGAMMRTPRAAHA
ncbi:hypothetical protein AA0119_g13415 [Alternaria tenuissima]|uniref:Uncharacterized protein n=2 Tax=Alternaria alternata complex TaxID=187734 RepID=A0A4Q4MTQ9_ALTAL|nr:hypothetical protein AA0114_g12871 [Alternaria tenuissima]RYN57523.1 hypothetical protein AA0117_g13216 [Alternaria alternata]RYN82562.1 hypothetical protein AA0119_g13415 [Alternaria tenuissima]RYO00080.1 hypothetical protein AA0121_g13435 [Alternaria tenuissima]